MLKNTIKRSLIITLAILQIAFYPHAGFAVDGDPAPTDTSTNNSTGPDAPTGADSSTFTYNEATGLWENAYYTWDPVTKQTAPKTPQDYSYNPDTGHWDTTQWRYDAPSGKYVPNIVEVATPPAGAPTSGGPGDAAPQALSVTAAGSDSDVSSSQSSSSTGNYDLFYNASISNKIKAAAMTGDAIVLANTTGGSALTGDAFSQATVLNLLQSVWDPSNGDIATFTANIDGDVTGDLVIDPGQIPSHLDATDNNSSSLTVNASEDTLIDNQIDLSATSGNARVDRNTSAGDATSGTAAAVANVVNLINSVIGSGQSFVGTININGNLNGDILLPPEMLNQLLASNVPRATISTDQLTNADLLAQFNSNQTINNNVSADSGTGNANVSNNSTAGGATTGKATNTITILNLTGRDIIGSNAMLVFVNVLGSWVGMIMDAPGATSAALGGGITSDTANIDAAINADSKQTINNDITLAAHSGNADVTNNTSAGSARTGDASTSANIANVSNSNLSLGGWFGVLFINVFGSWLGSFGVNTSAGDKPVTPPAPDVKVFQFVPSSSGASTLRQVPTTHNLGTAGTAPEEQQPPAGTVLGASTNTPVYGGVSIDPPNNIAGLYLTLAFISLLTMGGGKLLAFLKARRANTITNTSI